MHVLVKRLKESHQSLYFHLFTKVSNSKKFFIDKISSSSRKGIGKNKMPPSGLKALNDQPISVTRWCK